MKISSKIRKQVKESGSITFSDNGEFNELTICYGKHSFYQYPSFAKASGMSYDHFALNRHYDEVDCDYEVGGRIKLISVVENGRVILVTKTWKAAEEKINSLILTFDKTTGTHRNFYKRPSYNIGESYNKQSIKLNN